VAVWGALVAGALAVGLSVHPGYPAGDWVPPLHGHRRAVPWSIALPVLVGLAAVLVLPRLAGRLEWRTLVGVGWLGAAAWAVILAVVDGPARLAAPLATEHEYLAALGTIGGDPVAWLGRFAGLVESLPTHAAGHPPLATLVFWALDAIGLGGPGWAATLCIVAGASAVPAVLVTVRALVDEPTARRAAPFLVLAPFALTVATSADAIFLGVSAWAVAALALAVVRRPKVVGPVGPGSIGLGVIAGVLFGVGIFLSYGLVVAGGLAVAVLVIQWVPRVAVAAVGGAVAVVVVMALAGFWWFDGVAATAVRWDAGAGSNRPYWFTIIGNVAVLALIVGPAAAAALPRLRQRGVATLVVGALVAVLALDVSGVTRGEVERIWLPFAPWIVLACTALPQRWVRSALVAQVAVAVAVQALVRLSW